MQLSQIVQKSVVTAAGLVVAGMLAAAPALADPEDLDFGQKAEIPSPAVPSITQ
ncbi:hypothetical protein I540_2545 [Mycobacteroides abscessus subsp. bolletii 1513]|uniref:Uncharacterized protein n=1 Tax=Mycobacteroides abscessus subsp. bolletii 1513 TaxID=1299321 RepID=X8DPU0_9MYCO|nr:hypothetical protein I540_2545 [Mycobacteroides abscessus subsp. bolletii 1513]